MANRYPTSSEIRSRRPEAAEIVFNEAAAAVVVGTEVGALGPEPEPEAAALEEATSALTALDCSWFVALISWFRAECPLPPVVVPVPEVAEPPAVRPVALFKLMR